MFVACSVLELGGEVGLGGFGGDREDNREDEPELDGTLETCRCWRAGVWMTGEKVDGTIGVGRIV